MFWTRQGKTERAQDAPRLATTAPRPAFTGQQARPVDTHSFTSAAPQLPLFQMHTPGTPIWSDTSYDSLARTAYSRNPIAFRAVRMIAEAAASTRLVLRSGGAEYADHWLLALLNQPGRHMSKTSLLETLVSHLLLEGNAYLLGAFVGGKPTSLFALRPDRVRVNAGEDGWPVGYSYTAGNQTISLRPDAETGLMPLAHLRQFHPLDDHYGQGSMEPARTALDLHQGASNWNKALLDNAARPSGALVYSGGNGHLDGEAFERLKAELEATYQGQANAGRPMLLEGGLDWRQMSMSPKDMDFQEARHSAMREIALAFGVPPMLLGLPGDNTYANYAEAQRALWRQAVLPLMGKVLDGITHWLAPLCPDETLELSVDLDAVEALSTEREALWRRVNEADFLTEEEKRIAVGYGRREKPQVKPRHQAGDEIAAQGDHD